MKKIAYALSLSAALSLSSVSVGFAEQAPLSASTQKSINLNEKEAESIKQAFTRIGVNPETQLKLINKIESGQLLDSINPDKQHLGITSKSVEETDVTYTENIITTYPDGSLKKTSITRAKLTAPTYPISTMGSGVKPGQTTCGSGYCSIQNALVYSETGVWTAQFSADYTLVDGDNNDYISDVSDYQISTSLFTSYSEPNLRIEKRNESLEGPAKASLIFILKTLSGSITQSVLFYVQNNSTYVS